MKRNIFVLGVAAAAFCISGGAATLASAKPRVAEQLAAPAPAYAPMAPFAPVAGKSWRGVGKGPDGKPIVDIARYEMILGGRALQTTHRLEGGDYGGRTIIFFDEGAKKYVFHYFTTAGFHTIGEIIPTKTGFTSVEAVQNHHEIAEVRAEAVFGDGTIRVISSHVTHDGAVSDGDELFYREIKDPGVLFFDEADALFGKRTEVKNAHDKYKDAD